MELATLGDEAAVAGGSVMVGGCIGILGSQCCLTGVLNMSLFITHEDIKGDVSKDIENLSMAIIFL